VSNSGPPIPPDALSRIFDRFVRLNQDNEGSGLGLAITRSIVLAHRGTMAVHSGERTTDFVIGIPLQVAQ
jgi:two-component system, OmpR family, heavy metal sensor histidine kinase CusS